MAIPSLNPYLAPSLVCPACGDVIAPEVARMNKHRVSEVVYLCANPATNCAWKVNVSLQHVAGEMTSIAPTDLEDRRNQAMQFAEFRTKREAQISQLIAILPKLLKVADLALDTAELPAEIEQTAVEVGI